MVLFFHVPLANSYFVKNSEKVWTLLGLQVCKVLEVSTYYVGLVWKKSLGIHFFKKGNSQEEKTRLHLLDFISTLLLTDL